MDDLRFTRIDLNKEPEMLPIKRFTFPRTIPPLKQLENGVGIKEVYKAKVIIQDKFETLIYNNIVEIAKEEKIDELVVIDKEFIVTALRNEVERRKNEKLLYRYL